MLKDCPSSISLISMPFWFSNYSKYSVTSEVTDVVPYACKTPSFLPSLNKYAPCAHYMLYLVALLREM